MAKNKHLLITDNLKMFNQFNYLLEKLNIDKSIFDFAFTLGNKDFVNVQNISPIIIKNSINIFVNKYEKIFSLHSRQFFPKELVNSIMCINVHPGYNPNNRGWYPQVFSIINNEIIGATIHIMDEQLDHGDIIDRKKVKKYIWDTSESLYDRILEAEVFLLEKNLIPILNNSFTFFPPENIGKIYYKKDFKELCKINLNKKGTFLEFYNLLRALSHGNFDNAYFIAENDEKIFIKIMVSKNDK